MKFLKPLLPTLAAVIFAVGISKADLFYKWSVTAANNSNSDTFTWAEGQAPSTVNDSARGMMAALARFRLDQSGSLATAGTSTAYTLTSNQVFDTLANMSGNSLCFVATVANGASATLNVDGLGAKALMANASTALPTGSFAAGQVYCATYQNGSSAWFVHGLYNGLTPAGTTLLSLTACPTGWTTQTTFSDRALIISGTTPSLSGGTTAFISYFSGTTATGSTAADLAAHSHTSGTLATGAGSSHSHGLTQLPIVAASGPGGLNIAAGATAYGASNLGAVTTDAEAAHTHSVTSGSTGSTGAGGGHTHTIPSLQYLAAVGCTKN